MTANGNQPSTQEVPVKISVMTGKPVRGGLIPTFTFCCAECGNTFTFMGTGTQGVGQQFVSKSMYQNKAMESAREQGWSYKRKDGWICPDCTAIHRDNGELHE